MENNKNNKNYRSRNINYFRQKPLHLKAFHDYKDRSQKTCVNTMGIIIQASASTWKLKYLIKKEIFNKCR